MRKILYVTLPCFWFVSCGWLPFLNQDHKKLHCAALLLVTTEQLANGGAVSVEERLEAHLNVVEILAQLPGDKETRVANLQAEVEKMRQNSTPEQIFKEYDAQAGWCNAHTKPAD